MPEPEHFEFTHAPDDERIKYLLFRHYRNEPMVIFVTDSDKQLELLADHPVKNSKEFGVKMVIALAHMQPSKFFYRCASNGQLKQYFPELFSCIGCVQDSRYHADDVFEHTMCALDKVEHPEVLEGFNSVLDIKLAVLFHDVGKFLTRKITTVL